MNYALINSGKIENIIVADEDFIRTLEGYDYIVKVDDHPEVSLGWLYENSNFVKPQPEIVSNSITTVTIRQLKLALLKLGKLSAVPEAISSMESPLKEEVEIEWQYATSIKNDGFITKLAPLLGITVEEIFKLAENI